jgi:hypothetical protein
MFQWRTTFRGWIQRNIINEGIRSWFHNNQHEPTSIHQYGVYRRHENKFEKLLLTDDEVNNQLLITTNQSQDELFRLLCTTIKYSGFFEWNIVYKSFNLSSDLNYRKILLRSLGCSREISLINSYINFLVQKEYFKFSADILQSLSENKIGMKYVMDYFSINWKTIIKILNIKQLSVIFKNISNENEYKVVSCRRLCQGIEFCNFSFSASRNIQHLPGDVPTSG